MYGGEFPLDFITSHITISCNKTWRQSCCLAKLEVTNLICLPNNLPCPVLWALCQIQAQPFDLHPHGLKDLEACSRQVWEGTGPSQWQTANWLRAHLEPFMATFCLFASLQTLPQGNYPWFIVLTCKNWVTRGQSWESLGRKHTKDGGCKEKAHAVDWHMGVQPGILGDLTWKDQEIKDMQALGILHFTFV